MLQTLFGMDDSRRQHESSELEGDHQPQKDERLSILNINHGSPTFSPAIISPTRSVHLEVEDVDAHKNIPYELSGVESTAGVAKTELTVGKPAIHSHDVQDELVNADKTPKASEFPLKEAPDRRSSVMERRSLLTEPVSFLSISTSSRESSILPSPVIKSKDSLNSYNGVRGDTPVWTQRFEDHDQLNGGSRLLNLSPGVARVLGPELQALATEQGGIPISALSLSTYSQASASSASPNIFTIPPLSPLVEEKSTGANSPPWLRNPVQLQPLKSHPSGSDNILRRSATLPTKITKRPTFLPTPLEAPTTGVSFTRESVLSTPYPGSGFNLQKNAASISGQSETSKHLSPRSPSLHKIPIIVRDSRNCTSGVGKIDLPSAVLKKSSTQSKDDCYLAQAIESEYTRLRGHKTYFSARALLGVKIVFKSHSRDFFAPSSEPSSSQESYFHPSLHSSEEGRAAAFIASQRVISRAAAATASKRHLEESLGFLLKRPSIGRDNHTCSSDLRRLILEAARPDENGGPRGTVALEIVEGWHWVKIVFVVVAVLLASMLALLLWVLLGVEISNVDARLVGSAVKDTRIENSATPGNSGWHGAGMRVTSGALLGLLVLLLGWSWIGLWMGMSWLVG